MLDTHYYGGIKKYQWVALPLALHGVVAKKDGSVLNISIGDKPEDPSSAYRTCFPIWPPNRWKKRPARRWKEKI